MIPSGKTTDRLRLCIVNKEGPSASHFIRDSRVPCQNTATDAFSSRVASEVRPVTTERMKASLFLLVLSQRWNEFPDFQNTLKCLLMDS